MMALTVTWEQLQNGKGSLVFDKYWPRLERWVNGWPSGTDRSVLLAEKEKEMMIGLRAWHRVTPGIVRSHHLEFNSTN